MNLSTLNFFGVIDPALTPIQPKPRVRTFTPIALEAIAIGDDDSIQMAQLSAMYARGEVSYSMLLEKGDEYHVTEYPCSECSKKILFTVSIEYYRKKNTSDRTWQRRIIKANKEAQICPRCGTEHRFMMSQFKVKRKHKKKEVKLDTTPSV